MNGAVEFKMQARKRLLGTVGRSQLVLTGALALIGGVASAAPVSAQQGEASAPNSGPHAQSDPCSPDGATCMILTGVTINGAKAFSPAELASAYDHFLAQSVDLEDLAMIAGAITRRYLDEGYFLTRAIVPPQDMSSGVAQILVIEGRISEVEMRGGAAEQARPYFSGLTNQTIANLKDMDLRLSLAGDIPGVSLRSEIQPMQDDPANHRLVVSTEHQKVEAFVYADNRGTEAVGPVQAFGRLSANSVFTGRDQLSVTAFTTPEEARELSQIGVGYRMLVGPRSEYGLSTMFSRAQDGYDIASPRVGADGHFSSLWYSRALSRSRKGGLWLDANFDAAHFESEWETGGGYADELRVARVMLRGRHTDDGASTNVLVRVSAGLDALGASGESSVRRSRYDATGAFTKFNLQASHYRDLGDYFGIYAALDGQWSADPLLLSEEYAVGGARIGRAYNYGEISGDNALAGVLELRAGFDPPSEALTFLQGYAFYDAAQVWNYNTPAGADELSLSSAGLGLRLDFQDWLTARFEAAKPLTRRPFETGDKNWRQFFSLSASY